MYSIKTKRLLLSHLKESEISPLKRMLSDPAVTRHLFAGKPMSSEEVDSFIEMGFMKQSENFGLGSVCDLATNNFVGFAGIIPCEYAEPGNFEFGCAFQKSAWGKGYAKEIGRAQILYAFENLDIDQLFALAHPDNEASNRALVKLGLKLLKEIQTKERGERLLYCIERHS